MSNENNADVKWALDELKAHLPDYSLQAAYYDGNHRLAFATEKFRNHFGRLFQELSINHCAVVVDVPADRLQVEGFALVDQEDGDEQSPIARKVNEIWRRNRMNKRAGEVHLESLKVGDAYVVVDWTDNIATIFPNQAARCCVQYDEENPGYIQKAAKWWTVAVADNKFEIRLNLYYRDKILKFKSSQRSDKSLPISANDFKPLEDEEAEIANPYDKVPVFHFANNADMGMCGKGEIKPVVAPQDGLNKAVCDVMVAAEYVALGQRYVAGIEISEDGNGNPVPPFRDGLANLWAVPPAKDADGKTLPASEAQPITFGQFAAADTQKLLEIKESFRKDISLISGIPAHYFMETSGGWPSGEALKTAEQRLSSKVTDRQISFGNTWEDVMRFCLQIEGQGDVTLETKWKETGPVSDKDNIENAATMVEKLGIPKHEAWRKIGYKDSQIEQLEDEVEEQNLTQINQANTVAVPTMARNTTQGIAPKTTQEVKAA